jgi:hypothetical protein
VKYQQKTFSIPVGNPKLPDLDYDLRVGKITQKEYERLKKKQEQNARK